MIVVKEEFEWYCTIYSDQHKKILEVENGALWDATEENPIAVNTERYNNGDYVESDEDIVEEEGGDEDAIEEISE